MLQAEHLLPATFDIVACIMPTLKSHAAPGSSDTFVLSLVTAGRCLHQRVFMLSLMHEVWPMPACMQGFGGHERAG